VKNANKLKNFLLETLCSQYKFQTDMENELDDARPDEIFLYIHKNWCPSDRVLEQLLKGEYNLLRQEMMKGQIKKWCSEIKNIALKAQGISAIWTKRIIPNLLNDTA
jgi:hypothetical protein